MRGIGLVLGLCLMLSPLATAQLADKTPRIGFLRRTSPEPADFEAFRQGLRGLGYVEGQNVVIEQRYAHGVHERLSRTRARSLGIELKLVEVRSADMLAGRLWRCAKPASVPCSFGTTRCSTASAYAS